jgi:hypothetical protein
MTPAECLTKGELAHHLRQFVIDLGLFALDGRF